jgi:4-azaleucine resistance transporter AzlC
MSLPGRDSAYVAGARAIAPLTIAAVAFGITFGLLARAAGFGVAAPIVMSATVFAGSAQFAAVSVLGDGGATLAAVAAAVLLNARYGAMGISAAPAFQGGPMGRLLTAQLLVDESWAIAQADGRFDVRRMMGAGALLYVCWVGGTAAGVAGATLAGSPEALGMDAAFPALFLALLGPRLRERRMLMLSLAAGAVALALTPVLPPGLPVVAAGVVAVAGWWR